MTPIEQTTAIQREVASPERSAWVSANAGTGKTHVLVRRVIRQLLSGSEPESIVCITFTKAAAAEMADRLFKMLSEWALADDTALAAKIEEMTGERPASGALPGARELFARALECPGGLKIQTIHGFCASVLSRFPAEAGLPLGFRALEEDEAEALLRKSLRALVVQASRPDHPLYSDYQRLTELFEGEAEEGHRRQVTIEDLLRHFMQQTRGLRTIPVDGRHEEIVEDVLGVVYKDEKPVLAAFEEGLDRGFLGEIAAVFPHGGKNAQKMAEKVTAFLEAPLTREAVEKPFALTEEGKPVSVKYLGKTVCDRVADFERRWAELGEHFIEAGDALRLARILQDNVKFIWMAVACIRLYKSAKEREGVLDYDDLIEETLRLLQNVDEAWVRFRLDTGIDHVLLDEAQDTSLSSWELFDQLVEEIRSTSDDAAGEERRRTIFVVGDPKQSIYAFNGAEAALFAEKRAAFEEAMRDRLASRQLFLSFRTCQPVLDAVDAVFSREEFRVMAGGYQRHDSSAPERSGSVELWPHLPDPEEVEDRVWDAPVDRLAEDSIDRRLARAIAEDIRQRTEGATPLACRDGKPAAAGDVMVLFQRRGPRFHETIRALGELGVPCAGTDRVALARDTAVRDLICLLRFAANTDDGLSLAVLLRSPFFGWSEDELFDLCADPGRKGILWSELQARAMQEDALAARCEEARGELQRMLDAGARRGPYALLSAMMDGGRGRSGRSRFAERLGTAHLDALETFIDEALAFEDIEPRSIHGFLHRAESISRDIKRELSSEEDGGVRVMTVHGAKGLEAPIVYLADADYLKQESQAIRREPFVKAFHPLASGPVPILIPASKGAHPGAVSLLRAEAEARRMEEYQRLLYVAMTRAEEHLIVCGGKAKNGDPKRWHDLVREGFAQLQGEQRSVAEAPWGGTIERWSKDGVVKAGEGKADRGDRKAAAVVHDAPAWLDIEAPREVADPVIYPSAQGAVEEDGAAVPVTGASADARRRGILVHRLLELLPNHPEVERAALAGRFLAGSASTLSPEERSAIAETALRVLGDPRFAPLFGPGSRAEVSIQGQVSGVMVSGQIDRLLITAGRIVAAEFKSTRWVPETDADIPRAHREQLEAYLALLRAMEPGKEVAGVLLYTAAPRAFEIG